MRWRVVCVLASMNMHHGSKQGGYETGTKQGYETARPGEGHETGYETGMKQGLETARPKGGMKRGLETGRPNQGLETP